MERIGPGKRSRGGRSVKVGSENESETRRIEVNSISFSCTPTLPPSPVSKTFRLTDPKLIEQRMSTWRVSGPATQIDPIPRRVPTLRGLRLEPLGDVDQLGPLDDASKSMLLIQMFEEARKVEDG